MPGPRPRSPRPASPPQARLHRCPCPRRRPHTRRRGRRRHSGGRENDGQARPGTPASSAAPRTEATPTIRRVDLQRAARATTATPKQALTATMAKSHREGMQPWCPAAPSLLRRQTEALARGRLWPGSRVPVATLAPAPCRDAAHVPAPTTRVNCRASPGAGVGAGAGGRPREGCASQHGHVRVRTPSMACLSPWLAPARPSRHPPTRQRNVRRHRGCHYCHPDVGAPVQGQG